MANSHLRNWLIAFVVCTVIVVLCIAYVDFSAAAFIEKNIRHTASGAMLEHAFLYVDVLVLLPLIFMLACGLWALSGRHIAAWTEIPLLCCWSMVWCVVVALVLKHLFGRTASEIWVAGRTDFTGSGFSSFHLLHGTIGQQGFPSGTASITASIVSVVWILAPKLRPVTILALLIFSTTVVLVNFHYVSDVIAGIFLGCTIGSMTVWLQSKEQAKTA